MEERVKFADKLELVDLGMDMMLKCADKRIDGLLQVIALHSAETETRAEQSQTAA